MIVRHHFVFILQCLFYSVQCPNFGPSQVHSSQFVSIFIYHFFCWWSIYTDMKLLTFFHRNVQDVMTRIYRLLSFNRGTSSHVTTSSSTNLNFWRTSRHSHSLPYYRKWITSHHGTCRYNGWGLSSIHSFCFRFMCCQFQLRGTIHFYYFGSFPRLHQQCDHVFDTSWQDTDSNDKMMPPLEPAMDINWDGYHVCKNYHASLLVNMNSTSLYITLVVLHRILPNLSNSDL